MPPDVAPVLLTSIYEAHNAPAYQISTQSGNAQLSYWSIHHILPARFFLGCISELRERTRPIQQIW